MKRPRNTKEPLTRTFNAKANAYQRLLDIAAQADASEGIRQGLEDVKKGRVRPAREALETFWRSHALRIGAPSDTKQDIRID
jgi:hypothetical protein